MGGGRGYEGGGRWGVGGGAGLKEGMATRPLIRGIGKD